MFLDALLKRNRGFLEATIALHQGGALPANCYVLDLDAVHANAVAIRHEADRHRLEVFAMTKQVGRAPGFIEAVQRAGIDAGVAVDMTDARALARAGMDVGHVGHLVQVPRAEADAAAALRPRNWTVFSHDKAAEAAAAAARLDRVQDVLARIHAPGDRFYPGHEGGFAAADVVAVADRIDREAGARFAGITTFPALLFDPAADDVRPTPNLATLERAAKRLRAAGATEVRVNAPGTTSAATLGVLAEHGVTQVEPGHGLTGTTPLHAGRDLPERPALCYVTEVSHLHADHAYAFGGGLYVDPVRGPYAISALVADGQEIEHARKLSAVLPAPDAIDYYARLEVEGVHPPRTGASVVFGFRPQAFVTRAHVAGIAGVSVGDARVTGVWNPDGRDAEWPS